MKNRPARLVSTSKKHRLLTAMLTMGLLAGAGTSPLDAQVRSWLPASEADNGDWTDNDNWTPEGVPNSTTAEVRFNQAGGYFPYIGGDEVEVGRIIFDGNIANYGLSIHDDTHGISVTQYIGGLMIHNEGVTNTSVSTQSISVSGVVDGFSSYLYFLNSSTAGDNMAYFIEGGALISFDSSANAGTAQIQNSFSDLFFNGNSSAQQSVITNTGDTRFGQSATADRATILNTGTAGGNTLFTHTSSAGQANITNDSDGSLTWFTVNASAAQATIVNKTGGATYFFDEANGTTGTTVNNLAGGALDISRVTTDGVTLGQVTGEGNIYLGSKNLLVGGKNLDGTISGVISDGSIPGGRFDYLIPAENTGGSVTKEGFGTLSVTAANTYTGGTTINAGILEANNTTGSATGSGEVIVNLGSLYGTGRVAGPVTVNGGTLGGSVVLASDLILNNNGLRIGSGTVEGGVTVNSGGRLSGTGTIIGDVVVNAGGHLAPGYSGTTLTTGNLFLDNAAELDFEFGEANAPGSGLNDVVNVNGNLTLDGILNISSSAGGDFGAGLYRLFNYTGTLINGGVVFGNVADPTELYVQTSVANQVNLINTDGLVLNFWDGPNPANYNNATINGGTGTWQLNPPNDNWTDSAGAVNVPYENGQFVIFAGAPGTVTVDNTNGAVSFTGAQFATNGYILTGDALTGATGTTTIRVGDGTIFSEGITATINAQITGATTLQKTDFGTLVLEVANTYTNGTIMDGGTLITKNANALGGGALTFNAGLLKPDGLLNVGGLNWNGGGIQVDLNQSPQIAINGDLTNGGGVRTFLLDFDGATPIQQSYTLLTYTGVTNFVSEDFVANLDYAISNVQFFAKFLVTDVNVQLVLGANAGGPLLQNSAPVLIPKFADFFVEGPVTTGAPDESNTINSLNFANGSSLEVFNNLTVTSGNIAVDSGAATLSGGTIIVPGDFNLTGPGMLIADTSFDIAGAANIYGTFLVNDTFDIAGAANIYGTLLVNDTFSAPGGLTVFQNALLGGGGTINGNVVNSGVVSPGNSPGVLTINGNFTQTAEGTLLIELASTSIFDQLVVNGNASLAGTLQIESFGGFVPQFGQQFDFLLANSITGEFDTIAVPNPEIFRGRILTDDGVSTLLIAPTSYTLLAQTQNQFNVAQALNSYIPATSGDRETVSIALDLQSAAEYPVAFNAIAPTFYESLANVTLEQTNAQNQLIAQRLSAVRLGSRGFSAVGIEAPLVNDKNGKNVMDAKDGKDILTPTVDNKWGVWVQGNGIFSKVVSVSQVPNYRFNSGGFLLGADYKWSENFTTGLYAGYQGTYAKYDDNSNLRVNSALFGGYATYDNGGFYVDAIVGGGYSNYTAKRAINFSTIDRVARSQPGGGQFTTYLDAGYDWEVKGFTFGPIISGQYTYAGVAPFTENGADSLDLKVSQQNANSIRTNIGGRVAYTWNVTSSITFIPEVRMFWQHEFLNNPRNIASSLDGGSGPGFGYETSAPARDSVFAGAGISARFGDRWDAYVYYNADFGRQDYLSHIVSAGLNFKF